MRSNLLMLDVKDDKLQDSGKALLDGNVFHREVLGMTSSAMELTGSNN